MTHKRLKIDKTKMTELWEKNSNQQSYTPFNS